MASGQGTMYSIFAGGKLTQNDVTAITNYANAMKGGANSAQAWSTGMNGASVAAKQYVLSARKAGKSTDEMVAGLNKVPKATTAASIGLKALSVAGNMLLFMGISMAISGLIKGVDYLIHREEKLQEALDESISTLESTTSEIKSLEEQVKTCAERIEELQKLKDAGTISLADEEELNNLKEENKELERQIALLQDKQIREGKQVLKDAKKQEDDKVQSRYKLGHKVTPSQELHGAVQAFIYAQNTDNDALADEHGARVEDMYEKIQPTLEAYRSLEEAGYDLSDAEEEHYAQLKKAEDEYLLYTHLLNGTKESFVALSEEMQKLVLIRDLFYKKGMTQEQATAVVENIKPEDYVKMWESDFEFTPPDPNDYDSAEEYGKAYADAWIKGAQEGVEENANKMTVSLENLKTASGGISSLASAFKELDDDGYVTIETISKIKEVVGDSVDNWDEYEKKLIGTKKNSKEFQETMGELAYSILENKLGVDGLANADEAYITRLLEENNVMNANKVAHDMVAKAKYKQYTQTIILNTATEEEKEGLIELAEQSGATTKQINFLTNAIDILGKTDLDLDEKCSELLKMATTAGIAMVNLGEASTILNDMQNGSVGALKKQEYSSKTMSELYQQSIQEVLDYYTGLTVDIDTKLNVKDEKSEDALEKTKEKTEDALDKTKEKSTETFNTIDSRLDKIKNTVNDILDKVNDNNTLKNNLKYLKQAQDYIKGTSKEFDKAYKTYMKKFNKVDLKQKYKDMIISGDLDIQDGSSENISKITKYANSQVGYKEYGDNGNKYASVAGHANYEAWCDTFVKAALIEALGKDGALKAVGAGILGSAGTSTSAQGYKNRNQWYQTPKVGDQVFFSGKNGEGHTGLVTGVNGTKITFVEGNASNKVSKNTVDYKTASGQRKVLGFGRPDYGVSGGRVKVKDGLGNIIEFDSDSEEYKNLKKAKEHYDSAQSAEKGKKELYKLFQDSLEREYDEINKFHDAKISLREDAMEASGITTKKDLNFLINQEKKRGKKLAKVREKMLKEGELKKGSVAWKEMQADIDKSTNAKLEYLIQRKELAADINTKTDIDDLNFQLDLTNNAIDYDEAKGNYANTNLLQDRIAINKKLIAENAENISIWEKAKERAKELYGEDSGQYLRFQNLINDAIKENGELNIAILEDEQKARDVLLEKLQDQLSLLEATQSELQSINDLTQAMGKDLSANDYQKLIDNNLSQISSLQSSIYATWHQYAEQGAQGMMIAQKEVAEINAQINQLKISNEELKKQMRDDVYWRDFERAHEKVQNLQSVLESMVGFIDDDMMFIDGQITDFGISKLAALSHQFVQAKEDVVNYMNDLENLEKLYAKGSYNENEYKTKLQELKDGLLNATETVKGFSDSIVDLNQTLMENELTELKEVTESYIEALQKKKDYYDYDKTLRNSNKNIQQLKAQIQALNDVADAESRAKKARLEAELSEAEEDLADTKYDHYITLVTDGLNETVEDLGEKMEEYFEKLATDFDEISNIMLKAAELYESSADTIAATYNNLLTSLGVDTSKFNWNNLTGFATGGIVDVVKRNGDDAIISVKRKETIMPTQFTELMAKSMPVLEDLVKYQVPDYSKILANVGTREIVCDNSINLTVQGDLTRDTLPDLETIMVKSVDRMKKEFVKVAGNNGWKRSY